MRLNVATMTYTLNIQCLTFAFNYKNWHLYLAMIALWSVAFHNIRGAANLLYTRGNKYGFDFSALLSLIFSWRKITSIYFVHGVVVFLLMFSSKRIALQRTLKHGKHICTQLCFQRVYFLSFSLNSSCFVWSGRAFKGTVLDDPFHSSFDSSFGCGRFPNILTTTCMMRKIRNVISEYCIMTYMRVTTP